MSFVVKITSEHVNRMLQSLAFKAGYSWSKEKIFRHGDAKCLSFDIYNEGGLGWYNGDWSYEFYDDSERISIQDCVERLLKKCPEAFQVPSDGWEKNGASYNNSVGKVLGRYFWSVTEEGNILNSAGIQVFTVKELKELFEKSQQRHSSYIPF